MKDDIKEQSATIADTLSDYFALKEENLLGKNITKLRSDFEYMGIFSKVNHIQVWVITQNYLLLSYNDKKMQMEIDEIPTRYIDMVDSLLDGNSVDNTSYKGIWNRGMLGIGTPIFDKEGQVIGAVIVQTMQERFVTAIKSTLRAMVGCFFIALIITYLVAETIINRVVQPLRTIEQTTVQLAKGNYDVTTGIRQDNELGELAYSVDTLANELAKAKEVSDNLEMMRQNFISGISHELRTPVTVMRAMLDTLCDGIVTEKEEVEQYHKMMLGQCEGLGNLINDLLDLSKLQTPEFQMNETECNLCSIVEDAYRSMIPLAKEKELCYSSSGYCKEGRECRILGDYTRIRQLLMIFIDNAIKYTDTQERVSVKVEYGDTLLVVIEDAGHGIAEEECELIFERFYRGKKVQNTDGSGLGLAIAKQIAARLMIGIQVESKLGKGTRITLDFTELKL